MNVVQHAGQIYYCGGVNGVGKSTVLSALVAAHSDIRVVSGAKTLMSWLGLPPGDYEALRRYPRAQADDALEDMIGELVVTAKNEPALTIVDGHYLHILDGVVTSATRSWLKGMDGLILLTADPDVVWHRIEQDQDRHGRQRRLFPPGCLPEERQFLLSQYLATTKEQMAELGRQYHLRSLVVDNIPDHIPQATATIYSWVTMDTKIV